MIEIVLISLYIFIAFFILEVSWVFYTKHIHFSNAHSASRYATLMQILSSTVIVAYTSNGWFLIPTYIAAYTGTYYGIKYYDYIEKKRKYKNENSDNS
jgi:uncharacterized membrane protein